MAAGLPDAPIGVVGAGTMGAGIAQVAAVGGIDVKIFDVADGAADAARGRIAAFLERSVKRGQDDRRPGRRRQFRRIDAVSSPRSSATAS